LNYNQNQKIAHITSFTLVVGIDIAKDRYVARFKDDRGMDSASECSLTIVYIALSFVGSG